MRKQQVHLYIYRPWLRGQLSNFVEGVKRQRGASTIENLKAYSCYCIREMNSFV